MRRHHRTNLLLALPLALVSAACVVVVGEHGEYADHGRRSLRGSGHVVSEHRDVGPFHALELDTAVNAVVSVGEAPSVVVTADDNLLPYVTTEVHGGVLHVGLRSYRSHRGRLEVRITTPELRACSIDGAGEVVIEGLAGDTFLADIDGSGTIHARGNVRRVQADIDGSGNLELFELQAREASVSIDGAGNVSLTASERLEYSIDGAGHITYGGNPTVSGDVDGAGSATAR